MKKYLVKFKNKKFQRIELVEDPYNLNFYDNYVILKKQQNCVERSVVIDAHSEAEAKEIAFYKLYDTCDMIKGMLLDELGQCERAVISLESNFSNSDNKQSVLENIKIYNIRINYLKRLTCGVV